MKHDTRSIDGLDPVDRLAALQMSKGVKLHEPAIKPCATRRTWPACPTLKRHVGPTPDLTGRTVGRLKVIGPLKGVFGTDGSKWVVVCSCRTGDCYETRTSKAINNPNNQDDCCVACRNMRRKINQYHYFRR